VSGAARFVQSPGPDEARIASYSTRTFIPGPDDALYRLASAGFSRMSDDPHSHRPERFAGERLRMAEAIVEVRDRAPWEAVVKESALDWTILGPPHLNDGDHTGTYGHGLPTTGKGIQGKILQADVADFILKQPADTTYLHQTPGVSYLSRCDPSTRRACTAPAIPGSL
jgi:hypothetical protein